VSPRLLIATNNPGKVREYRAIFHGLPLELVTRPGRPTRTMPGSRPRLTPRPAAWSPWRTTPAWRWTPWAGRRGCTPTATGRAATPTATASCWSNCTASRRRSAQPVSAASSPSLRPSLRGHLPRGHHRRAEGEGGLWLRPRLPAAGTGADDGPASAAGEESPQPPRPGRGESAPCPAPPFWGRDTLPGGPR